MCFSCVASAAHFFFMEVKIMETKGKTAVEQGFAPAVKKVLSLFACSRNAV